MLRCVVRGVRTFLERRDEVLRNWSTLVLDPILSPIILYACLSLGAVGVAVALPRRGANPQIIGALIAAIAAGGLLVALAVAGFRSEEGLASLFFYVFSAIGLGAALLVITHPKPVYAALYFIVTVLASAGLFLLLSAEFMAFALIIIYAGAILITYLFVIMLATQGTTAEAVAELSECDTQSRDPIMATIIGFILLGTLTGMLNLGTADLPSPENANPKLALERLPGRVQMFLEEIGLADVVMPAAFMPAEDEEGLEPDDRLAQMNEWREKHSLIIVSQSPERESPGFVQVVPRNAESFRARYAASQAGATSDGGVKPLPKRAMAHVSTQLSTIIDDPSGFSFLVIELPPDVTPTNLESLGLALVGEHPLMLELAGVILLLAMIGAIVLARKQTELEEERKAAQSARLRLAAAGGSI